MHYILVVGKANNFIYPEIDEIELCELYRHVPDHKIMNRIFRLFYGFLLFFRLYKFVYGEWYRKLVDKRYNVVFLDECGLDNQLISIINKYKDRCVIYCWNPTNRINRFNNFSRIQAPIYSFDRNDCSKYGYQYKPSLIPNFSSFKPNNYPSVDLFFLGYDKGRRTTLERIKSNTPNLISNFIVVDDNSLKNTNPISYSKYLEYISNSKAIIEILQSGQVGETIRTIESISLRKKLITNNSSLKFEDYYNNNNIMIFSTDCLPSEEEIKTFIDSPFDDLCNETIIKRQPIEWIRSFFD